MSELRRQQDFKAETRVAHDFGRQTRHALDSAGKTLRSPNAHSTVAGARSRISPKSHTPEHGESLREHQRPDEVVLPCYGIRDFQRRQGNSGGPTAGTNAIECPPPREPWNRRARRADASRGNTSPNSPHPLYSYKERTPKRYHTLWGRTPKPSPRTLNPKTLNFNSKTPITPTRLNLRHQIIKPTTKPNQNTRARTQTDPKHQYHDSSH